MRREDNISVLTKLIILDVEEILENELSIRTVKYIFQ